MKPAKRQLNWIVAVACLALLVFVTIAIFQHDESKSLAVGEKQNLLDEKPSYPVKAKKQDTIRDRDSIDATHGSNYNATAAKSSDINFKLIEIVIDPELIEVETQKALEKRVGSKSKQPDKKEILSINGRVVFSGFKLSKAYQSEDGAIVLSAYDSPDKQLANADLETDVSDGKLDSNISSVWYIDPSGQRLKLGPQGIHGENPIISSDGKLIAFSGRQIDEYGFPGNSNIFIYSASDKSYKSIGIESEKRLVPLYWEKDFLTVLEADGENMTHAKISRIQIGN